MKNDLNSLIFGCHSDEGLIACERGRDGNSEYDEMVLYVRRGGKTVTERESFIPFIWIKDPELLAGSDLSPEIIHLSGNNPLDHLAFFASWNEFQAAVKALRRTTGRSPTASDAPYFVINDPVQQHLMLTGRTFFKGLSFGDLKRMQVDIETYTAPGYEFSNPEREEDRIIAIAMADETGWTEVLSGADLDEKSLLQCFMDTVRDRDPDIIEGHNIFKFDFAYILTRAAMHRVSTDIGRDGSRIRVSAGRYTAGERAISYPKVEIHGRHVVDTFFMVQSYDITHRSLEGFGLKEVARHFGISPDDRVYLKGSEIARTFNEDPDTVMKYARDDIIETRALSDLLSPVYFAKAQILPFTYQNVVTRGSATKIDSLMLREYLRKRQAVPSPEPAREFAGGYTDIFFTGLARNVHHCDVRSLYPSLMLALRIGPQNDDLGVFLRLLEYLRSFRLDAKERMRKADPETLGYLDALQTAYKVLINSFYGYLGFGMARFNDFDAASRVAEEGRKILKDMIEWIRENGGRPIEIDTDGIYFIPPDFRSESEMKTFQKRFQRTLPEGLDLEFDGSYRAMFSYKMKNYALLNENGEIQIKGAALKSRGLEPFQRDFLRDMIRLILEERVNELPALKQMYAEAILNGKWHVKRLAKTETLQDNPATYMEKIRGKSRGRNAAYELALKSQRDYRAGDQVSYYVTGSRKTVAVHESAKLVSDWNPDNRDENVPYYLAKLNALVKKFEDILEECGLKKGDFEEDRELWNIRK